MMPRSVLPEKVEQNPSVYILLSKAPFVFPSALAKNQESGHKDSPPS